MRDIEFLLMMIHIPGLFEGTCIPTFHLSFHYDPRQQDIRQQLQFTAAVLTTKDAHLEHMRTLGLEGTQQSDTWDASQQEVQHMKASIELESPTTAASLASHSALFKCIFSVVGRDSTSQFVEFTGSNGHIRRFTESALDPRNIDLDWEGALMLYFSDARQDDHLSKTPSQLCAMAVKYFSQADEKWKARGEAWVSLRIPRGYQRLLSESPAVLYSIAGQSDPVVETGLRRFAYAFPHEIEPSSENDII
ncbi:hypothetical protein RQP46_001511 [Phenoliferia psychrophenolica]